MSKTKRKTRQKIVKTLVSVFVLATFLVPTYLTSRWLVGAFGNRDPRKVSTVSVFQARPADSNARPLQPFNQPLVSVTFDDGWESVYTNALPVLQQNGIHTTQYIITGTFSNYQYMSVAQVHSLNINGHEIGAHTITHPDLTTLDQTTLTHELVDSKKELQQRFGVDAKDFTSPYGAYNAHTLQQIGVYYRSQKNAEGDPAANELEAINVSDSFNALNIKSYSVRNTTSLNDLKKLIKAAQDNNGWLVLTYHQIDNSGETFSVSPDAFRQQMQLLNGSNIRIPTLGSVIDTLLPVQRQDY